MTDTTSQPETDHPPSRVTDWLVAEPDAPPVPAPRRRWLEPVLLAAIVLIYAAIQFHFFTPACHETDTAGYVWLAERFALGLPVAVPDDPFRYLSHVWVQPADGLVLPKYPPGLPALMAIGIRLAGDSGPYLVSPLCGALCLLGMWYLCRIWMSPLSALCATATLAFGDMYLMYTGYPLAHAANTCAVTWGMAFLFRWLRRPTVPLSIGAGLCLGLAPVIRPTSVLLWLVPIAVAVIVIYRTWRNRRAPDAPAPLRAWLPVAILPVAGAIFPAGWLAYNQIHFGSPFVTGYDLAGEQYAFLWSSWPGITRLLKGLLAHGPAVVAGIGLFAILLWPRRLERLLLLLWLLPLIVAYGVYYWSLSNGGAMVTRFLLCLFPLIVAAAFAGLEHVLRTPRSRLVVPIVLAALAIAIDAPGSARDMRQVVAAPDLHQQLTAFRAIRPHLRDGAVLIAGEPLIFHLGPGHNWQLYDHQVFEPRYVLNQTRHRRHSDPRQQPSRIQAITNYYTNHQTDLPALYREFVRKRLAAGDQVAIVLPTERLASEQSRLGKAFQITQLTEWSQPRTRWQRDDDGHWYESSYDETQALYGITLADR